LSKKPKKASKKKEKPAKKKEEVTEGRSCYRRRIRGTYNSSPARRAKTL